MHSSSLENRELDESGEDFTDEGLFDSPERNSPCYITVERPDGEIEHIKVIAEKDEFSSYSTAAFINPGFSAELETKKKDKFSPFNKKSGVVGRRRIISKTGDINVQLYRVSRKRRQFIKDVFTTCVDMKWRWTLLVFTLSFFVSWLIFAVIWYLIALIHGDLEPDNLPQNQGDSGWVPCVYEISNFASAFLFSVETQHTIGYGSRGTSDLCEAAIICESFQSILGVIIQACMAGIVFAKLARPKQRSNTVMFSRNAVITLRNGDFYLMFRVGNMRTSQLLEAHCRAQFIHKVMTKEGESLKFCRQEIQVGTQVDGTEDRCMMLWPNTISHKIDQNSPLWKMGPKELLSYKFEIIVILEAIVEPTGNNTQARSSFIPSEILWGHRFDSMVSYLKHKGVYAVDCCGMNQVSPDHITPMISAKDYHDLKQRRVLPSRRGSLQVPSFLPSHMKKQQNHSGRMSQMSINDLNKFIAQHQDCNDTTEDEEVDGYVAGSQSRRTSLYPYLFNKDYEGHSSGEQNEKSIPPSPNKMSSSPNKMSSSPNKISSSPNKISASPNKKKSFPEKNMEDILEKQD
ncbi:ATP-sensitive inward rectifier potassium channel 12 [Eurytemora carolleeae]|uniref:ATP-sensitive inward rectifier potassium channel 12 n=1 Tax=Eurytemora carolleeae TaxID=1294199 RepID=UPI000C758A82|nr:ATP-sensitive inward rectifier potassium channel 12 [Eurytemora carolleeae]|eukprot:XP_023331211.1 ATP-sensitive inward rectifier potassium channel 12-like [Eurytemora affinis]